MSSESLADRLNRLKEQKERELKAEATVQQTQDQINTFIYQNARPEYNHLLEVLAEKIAEVNPELNGLPAFELRTGGPFVQQGNCAAFLSFVHPTVNAPPIYLMLSFGREPTGIYFDLFGPPPEPERYKLQPAKVSGAEKIVWVGDLGEMSSEQLSEFILNQLTQYFLDHKKD